MLIEFDFQDEGKQKKLTPQLVCEILQFKEFFILIGLEVFGP